ncbi:MAG: uncharacterized protein JWO86_2721 [Myxococcaceae bacterium]|nr:uncharacterized protein [Myxococcaceae bacterium]MEA2752521.1 hypothetical protein [Myxococcales bacterium]
MSKSMTAAGLVTVVVSLAVAGCEHEYVYRPTVATTSAINGRPASYYAIPPEAPRGSVQLATFGFAEINPSGDDKKLRAIHIRMVVTNNDDTPWKIDTREQLLELPNSGRSRPAFANSDAGPGPIVDIPPSGKRTIDLFYPLPEHMQDAKDVPEFDTLWKVETPTRPVADRTPFERLEVVPYYAYDDYGWGPGYYYDPYYLHGGAFVGVRIGEGYEHRPVIIRPSHGGFHGGRGGRR